MSSVRYQSLGPLLAGEGSRAFLGLALEDGASPRPVVLIWAPQDVVQNPELKATLRRETARALVFEHPHILRVHALAEQDGGLARVTEFADGEPLRRLLEAHPRLPPHFAALVVADAAVGLHYAHVAGNDDGTPFVHGDVRPETLMISFGGLTKVTGYGALGVAPRERGGKRVKNRRLYSAPEQLLGGRDAVNVQSDVFLLGLVLHECLSGKIPFKDAADPDKAVLTRSLPPMAQDVPLKLDAVLRRATAKRAKERYPTALAFREAVVEAVGSLPTHAEFSEFLSKYFPPESEARAARRRVIEAGIAEVMQKAGIAPPAVAEFLARGALPPGLMPAKWPELPGQLHASGASDGSGAQAGSGSAAGGNTQAASAAGSTGQSGSGSAGAQTQSGAGSHAQNGAGAQTQSGAGGQAQSGAGAQSHSSAQTQSNTGGPSQAGAGAQAHSGAGTQHQSGAGTQAPSGSGTQAQSGAGAPAQAGAGAQAHSGAGAQPQSGEGTQTHPGATGTGASAGAAVPTGTMGTGAHAPSTTPPAAQKQSRTWMAFVGVGLALTVGAGAVVLSRLPSNIESELEDAGSTDALPVDAGVTLDAGPVDAGIPMGTLDVTVDPRVEVSIPGQYLGRTPVSAAVPAGRHVLTLSNPVLGIQTTRVITVPAGGRSSQQIFLNKGFANVRAPEGAIVTVDGRLIGAAPIEELDLYEGTHQLLVIVNSSRWQKTFKVEPGQRVTFDVNFEKPEEE
ncbi:protein kinase domain-containing protein [Myxococcus xanthus]|uniref:non-specific serine/threonine protein kinase n=1 Tax=Myxococcus xanthus TaxID=34 RepID=A0AAE6G270_MYXXA|nr:PEGA domain-containing protein [Myxococcus xanthus]QDE69407.1 serine/threonine protein kinase [Myxococcus xanthus]QDE76684.1 serine/threonine protein kinase [Myxococcus xanthus]QDE98255.1 serine/threonine protein kinase [Myxococcus xanthus]